MGADFPCRRRIFRFSRKVFCDSIRVVDAAVSPLTDDIEALKVLVLLSAQRADAAEQRATSAEAELAT